MGDVLSFVNVGSDFIIKAVDSGNYHRCVLSVSGLVKCFGYGLYGQLGNGDTVSVGGTIGSMGDALLYLDLGAGFNITAVSSGVSYHHCAFNQDQAVKCWGICVFNHEYSKL